MKITIAADARTCDVVLLNRGSVPALFYDALDKTFAVRAEEAPGLILTISEEAPDGWWNPELLTSRLGPSIPLPMTSIPPGAAIARHFDIKDCLDGYFSLVPDGADRRRRINVISVRCSATLSSDNESSVQVIAAKYLRGTGD